MAAGCKLAATLAFAMPLLAAGRPVDYTRTKMFVGCSNVDVSQSRPDTKRKTRSINQFHLMGKNSSKRSCSKGEKSSCIKNVKLVQTSTIVFAILAAVK